ncbi:protein adenylyltransferase SelO [Pseudogracilibacillus sp. SO30301A]|uniref:protein adenylyltransferase SelO n=1 Tax=Pseudogracilibacillus sp. SO30301A TaxID=3098291 RepID=UPI00300E2559
MENKYELGWNLENSYMELPPIFYTKTRPTPVQEPKLVRFNKVLASSLGLDEDLVKTEDATQIFAGNKLPEGSIPLAQAYAGHQFGGFTMLGDGRVILLGEQITPKGERVDIQLKGSGRTKYSRGGDGRAALGPMLREYLISEAMHALDIPTTRSLAVVTTGEAIFRETKLPGAILMRVASSHLRVGTFQYAAAWGEVEDLRALADYTIKRHFPKVTQAEHPYLALLKKVIRRQASLVAKWQFVGFIHGVMNTDNMTISGETIDYGPCAFMNTFDSNTVFSSIDTGGRYKYGNQPPIAHWNLTRFAETLLPLLDEDEKHAIKLAEDALDEFPRLFNAFWLDGMRRKLGMFTEEPGDQELCQDLLQAMGKYEADFTNTFLALTFNRLEGMTLFHSEEFKNWHKQWTKRLEQQEKTEDDVFELMKKSNPAIIPRNHLVEEALEAAVESDDYSVLENLLADLSEPFAHTKKQAEYAKLPVPTTPYQTFCGT